MGEAKRREVFSKERILAQQKEALRVHEEQIAELRSCLRQVISTESGTKLFQYLFLVAGGDAFPIGRNSQKEIDLNETMLALGRRSLYEHIRFHMSTEDILKVERHEWEKPKKENT